MLVSKRTFDDMNLVVSVCMIAANAMEGLIDGEGVEQDTDRVRENWPGVTPRDLRVAAIAMAFCLGALDGTIPKLSQPGYCNLLFRTEASNLDPRGEVGE